jgi:hypothetical protein
MNRSEHSAAGLSAHALCDTCRDVTQDTALTLRHLGFSYYRSALATALAPAQPNHTTTAPADNFVFLPAGARRLLRKEEHVKNGEVLPAPRGHMLRMRDIESIDADLRGAWLAT